MLDELQQMLDNLKDLLIHANVRQILSKILNKY